MSELQILEYVQTFEEGQLELLAKICHQFADGNTPFDLMAQHYAGVLNVFRAGDALVLTQTICEAGHSQLVVYGLIGRGIISNAEAICEDLKTVAKRFQCRSIGGNVFRPGLARLYKLLGAKPVYTFYELELG